MRSYKTIRKRNLAASVVMHLLVFFGMGIYLESIPPSVREGQKDVTYIRSYLYQTSHQQSNQETQKQKRLHKETKSENKLKTHLNKNTQLTKVSSTRQPPQTKAAAASTRSSGEETKELLALLHAAIQSKQQYPSSALQMERQGRVKIGFTLYTDGTISGVHLVKSCGTKSLDEAGLAAVRLAAPFKKVDLYLQTATEFSIDVVFTLNEESN